MFIQPVQHHRQTNRTSGDDVPKPNVMPPLADWKIPWDAEIPDTGAFVFHGFRQRIRSQFESGNESGKAFGAKQSS